MKTRKLIILIFALLLILVSCSSEKTMSVSEKIQKELTLSGENKQDLETVMQDSETVKATVNLDDYGFEEEIFPSNSKAEHATDLAFYAYRLYAGYYSSVKTGYATEWIRIKNTKKMFSNQKALCLLIPIMQEDKPVGVTTIYKNTNYKQNIKIDPSTTKYNINDTIDDTGYMQSLEYIVDKDKLVNLLEEKGMKTLHDIKYVSGYADGGFADFIYLDTDKGEFVIPYLYEESEKTVENGQIMRLYEFLEVLSNIEENNPNGYTEKNIIYYLVQIAHASVYIIPTAILVIVALFVVKKIKRKK